MLAKWQSSTFFPANTGLFKEIKISQLSGRLFEAQHLKLSDLPPNVEQVPKAALPSFKAQYQGFVLLFLHPF